MSVLGQDSFVLLVHREVIIEIVDEPRSGAEAPRDVALPGGNGPLGDCGVSHLGFLLDGSREGAGVVEETHVQHDLHLLRETKIEKLSLWVLVLVVEPSVREFLEALGQSSLGVGSARLDRVVRQMSQTVDGFGQVGTVLLDFRELLGPIRSSKDKDALLL